MKSKLYGMFFMCIVLCLAACGQSTEHASQSNEQANGKQHDIHIAAAASLTDVTKDLATAFNKQHKDVKVTFNYGGSGALRKQIESGANVDVFMSANTKDVDTLKTKSIVSKTYDYARNELVLIGAQGVKHKDVTALSANEKLALGEEKTVPAGKYAATYLKDTGVYDAVKPHIVYAKDVRQVLNYVAKGHAQMGFVYATDLYASKANQSQVEQIKTVELKEPIIYRAGVVSKSKEAQAWLTFLKSDTAQEIFKKHHFKA